MTRSSASVAVLQATVKEQEATILRLRSENTILSAKLSVRRKKARSQGQKQGAANG